jgi:hypothetical protein
MARALLALVLLMSAVACWRTVRPQVSGVMDLAPPGARTVHLTYLGVGGWIFQRGRDQVLTGPLFTNPSLLRTGLAGIHSDTVAVDRGMAPYDVSHASAILVGHAHYDHLMDVPRVARHFAPGAVILGSTTVRNTLGTWSGLTDRVLVVDDSAGTVEKMGRWIHVAPGVRVMPLLSHHAPHFEGFTLYHGTRDRLMSREPRWASEWLDGVTYAFLVDFLDPDGSVAFRIYYQDAVSAPPRGLAPPELVAERPVDVAILVPATFDQVDWYPEDLVQNLRPHWVLEGHWEDFFVPPEARTRSIRYTDMRHFERRLEAVHPGDNWLPELGTEFIFPVRSNVMNRTHE